MTALRVSRVKALEALALVPLLFTFMVKVPGVDDILLDG